MSQQQHHYDYDYDYPPPPVPRPPSTNPPNAGGSSSSAGPAGRNRPVSAHLPSISTAFLSTSGPYSATPTSGTQHQQQQQQHHVPYTPSALNPTRTTAPQTPVMEPYNPRQWSQRGQVSGSQMVFQQRQGNMPASTGQMTGMEAAMPSPPPPYSPATPENVHRAAVASPSAEQNVGFIPSPMAESSVRHSPQVPMSPAFPPPPPQNSRHRERSASGMGGNRSFFSLSGLRGKQPAQPEIQQPQPSSSAIHTQPLFSATPPAARRAASTGHMPMGGPSASSSVSSAGRDSPESRWQPGMPLPGPPPGPPPAGNRSQSLNRPIGVSSSAGSTPEPTIEAPRQRRAAAPPSNLGPVPPTPANWEDHDAQIVQRQQQQEQQPPPQPSPPAAEPLRIDTGSNRDSMLARRPAQRDMSAQGIRERRSRSRAAKTGDEESRPSDLVFSPIDGALSRRREHRRNVSGLAGSSSAPSSAALPSSSKGPKDVMTPPYTPAVGKSPVDLRRKQAVKVPNSASSDRPISHLLHTPNEDSARMQAPLSPARPPTSGSQKAPSNLDPFSLQAIERHRSFIEKEAAAATDEERLELFANFIVHESRLRRDRYSAAYNAMAGDIMDLTRDMWRSYAGRSARRAVTPSSTMSSVDPTVPSWASDGQPMSAHTNMPSSASSMGGDFTPATDSASVGEAEGFERSEGRPWAESFKPSLSPIPSMAVSTVPDEGSSRGRTASRWWEQSNSGSGSIGKPDRIEKSRRETKYMGISPAVLQAGNEDLGRQSTTPGTSEHSYSYGPDEYPPEKVGWHEGHDFDTPMATPHNRKASTPGVAPLDVSRLVTLPPPYPRHHPAINNSHPRLTDYRAVHRELADHTEVQKIKDSYMDQDFTLSRDQQEGMKKRRARARSDIQRRIADGSMSFADAAKAEADFDAEEAERGKTTARANFDVFEGSVSHPMNTLLTERLDKANDCMKQLRSDLQSGHDSADPDRAQEEGDEHPERLEKLTLLKWIFEAREQLHKEMFDLHAMRSEKYSEVILTPYRISKSQAKIDEATAFFQKDSMERQISYAKDSLRRFEEFQILIEQNVSRGVEDQLSAFWDIAPGLLEVIQQIPLRIEGFQVSIPAPEFEENPSYHQHPLQYLYSLLNHAEKSAYQFIESQINLLCLLHEVRTATTKSRLRLVEIERNAASPGDTEVFAEMLQTRREAEDQLTLDLKEKVGEVERQWQEALGDGMSECKERVSIWLEESGGLEDVLDE